MKATTTMILALVCATGAFAQVEKKPVPTDPGRSDKAVRLPFKLQKGQSFVFHVDLTGGMAAATGTPPAASERTPGEPGKGAERGTTGGDSMGMTGGVDYKVTALDTSGGTTTLTVAVDCSGMHSGMKGGPTGGAWKGLEDPESGAKESGPAGDTSKPGTTPAAGEQVFTVKTDSNGRITEITGPGGSSYERPKGEPGRATPGSQASLPFAEIGPHIALILGSGLHEGTLEPGRVYFDNVRMIEGAGGGHATGDSSSGEQPSGLAAASSADRERKISSMFGQTVDLKSLRMRVEGTGSQEGQEVVRLSILKTSDVGADANRKPAPGETGKPAETGKTVPDTNSAGKTLGQAYYRVSDGILQSCTVDFGGNSSGMTTGGFGQRITIRRVSDSEVPRND